jgi:site-specific recombinase XerD
MFEKSASAFVSKWNNSKALNYDDAVPREHARNVRVASVRAAMEELVKLFRKTKSRFYWFDFTVRGRRYRGSTGETKAVRATKVASVKLALALEHGELFPTKPTVLVEFSERFLSWLEEARLEEKTKKFYRNGCRLLRETSIFSLRLAEITTEDAERLKFPGSAANANCALRTLRRMLHKAEEWKLIARAPKIKLMKEHGRSLRLDDDAEDKLLAASARCKWRPRTRELFRDIIVLMRDTGMRNERELFRMRIGNLNWENCVIFVPDSKTPEGRRLVPMSLRVCEILRKHCGTRSNGWVFPSKRSASGHLRSICNLFRRTRIEAGLPKDLVLYCARHDYGTRILTRTGNLAAVMKTMGHRDVKTAMHYQHPELEVVRAALDFRTPLNATETNGTAERPCGTFRGTVENYNRGKLLRPSPF